MTNHDETHAATTNPAFRELPEPVRREDMVEVEDTRFAPDPQMGRDPENDFVLRHA